MVKLLNALEDWLTGKIHSEAWIYVDDSEDSYTLAKDQVLSHHVTLGDIKELIEILRKHT